MVAGMHNSFTYRPCVGCCLVNKERKILLAKRVNCNSYAWQMPQGGINPGEEADQAVFREMSEEIGTDKAQIIGRSSREYFYDFPRPLQGRVWDGRYRGQRQIWYLLKFMGDNKEICLDTAEPEFCEWQWCALGDVETLVVPFKRDVYRAVLEEFLPKILTAF